MDKIEIPLSKNKLLLGIGGSLLFVVLGLWLFTIVAELQIQFSPLFVKGVGLAAIVFFGTTGIYGIRKIFDRKIALTLDENGITDNTNASSAGLIKWDDIIEIRTEQIASTKFLLIYTNKPEQYLEQASGLKKNL